MNTKYLEFESLVRTNNKDLHRYAYWLCHDRALAEDMVQETFARAWKAIDSLHDAESAKFWLFTILKREVARHFKRKSSTERSLEELNAEQNSEYISYDDGFGSTERFTLNRAISVLPEKYCAPLLLQVIGGYTSDEIANILQIKPGAVMTRSFRARQQLRNILNNVQPEFF